MRVGDTAILKRLESIALDAAVDHGADFNRVVEAMRQAVAAMPADERQSLEDTIAILTDERFSPAQSSRMLKP
ncbi:hypothetical protein [Oryzibacter oryziterrae]|uniref:hypothetical protein n=1 Tax=Oryzibacter oryziterrae TaxID=2766474 RepID=UPI001F403845|nr:hypothetical protein [Oryzibacter oryziterrae]